MKFKTTSTTLSLNLFKNTYIHRGVMTQRHEFKCWKRPMAFHIAPLTLGKV